MAEDSVPVQIKSQLQTSIALEPSCLKIGYEFANVNCFGGLLCKIVIECWLVSL